MKLKLILMIISSAIIVTLVVVYYLNWISPYHLPEINEELTLEEQGLIFKKEEETLKNVKKSMVTNEQSEIIYQEVINQLNGDTDNQKTGVETLKILIKDDNDNLEYLNTLRIYMNSQYNSEEFISFLESLPSTTSIKLQKALNYVDLLQNPNLGIAILGQTSSKSIMELDDILKENPHHWLAHYARGLNNLYWPSGLLRTESAIKDLSYCLAVVKLYEKKEIVLELWPHAYIAYGDALIKERRMEEGIKVWKEGFSKYPNNKDLEIRAGADNEEAFNIVKKERGIEIFQRPNPNITDISVLWKNTSERSVD